MGSFVQPPCQRSRARFVEGDGDQGGRIDVYKRSLASLCEKTLQSPRSRLYSFQRPSLTRANENPALFEFFESLLDRCRFLLDRANLGHRFPTIRNRDRFPLTHLPQEFREPRLGFIGGICILHERDITSQTGQDKTGAAICSRPKPGSEPDGRDGCPCRSAGF